MSQFPYEGWSFAGAREPSRFGACQLDDAPGVDHAVGPRGTLCGITGRPLTTYRHLFAPSAPHSCPRCTDLAAAAPTQPSTQERLHDRVLAAAPGEVRDALLAALRRGAAVRLWLDGPAATLTAHYARLGELTEGAGAAAGALASAARPGLAEVEAGELRYLVVLPDDGGAPVVARGPRTAR
ncbi:hypothetical protein [Streptomyces sp. NPDC021020]|uniref:hypothetical protein n=1 Tax=Streptomyces sp. NPDC021020 TaxID=3365109 RepID=UPI0037A8A6CC